MKHRRAAFLSLLMALMLAFPGLVPVSPARGEEQYTRFSRLEMDIFDTVIQLLGYAESQEEFDRVADEVMARLREYSRIFDAYEEYPGLNNLCFVNLHAAEAPVEVPKELFDLLSWCKAQWESGSRSTNIAMGAVLSIWHDYRTAGMDNPAAALLPPMEELQAAARHTDFDDVVLDTEKQTVFFLDSGLKLDIGAVAKGFAADLIAAFLAEEMPSFLLSLGGNIYAGDSPRNGRAYWGVAVQDPNGNTSVLANSSDDFLDVLYVDRLTVVTSGDYLRYYVVDGERYHHIIDPKTLMPSRQMKSVTIVCENSLMADFLSTTLFILPFEEGLKLIEGMEGTEAIWVLPDDTVRYSSGMAQYARSLGAAQREITP